MIVIYSYSIYILLLNLLIDPSPKGMGSPIGGRQSRYKREVENIRYYLIQSILPTPPTLVGGVGIGIQQQYRWIYYRMISGRFTTHRSLSHISCISYISYIAHISPTKRSQGGGFYYTILPQRTPLPRGRGHLYLEVEV